MRSSQIITSDLLHASSLLPGSVIVVGISGGADSVALLHSLCQMRHALSIQIHAAHFNHHLRPSSNRDQAFVQHLAQHLQVPVTVGHAPLKAVKGKVSEDKARQMRYRFFKNVMKKAKADVLVLAHTSNDVAETVLMRFVRGSGLLGLRGILPSNDVFGVKVIRPLIQASREQVIYYLKRHKLDFCHDETNDSLDFTRNKVRHQLIPLLVKDYNPNIQKVLVDLARLAGDDYAYLLDRAVEVFNKNVVLLKSAVKIRKSVILKIHPSLRRMVLRLCFAHLKGDMLLLESGHIEAVMNRLSDGKEFAMHWPLGITVTQKKDILQISL